MQAKNFTLKKLLEILPDIKNAKIKRGKLIQVDNLQGTEKMLTLARSTILIYTRRWQSTVQATLHNFFTKKLNTSILIVFNVL